MQLKKHVYKILISVLIAVLLAGITMFVAFEFAGLPNCDISSRKQAVDKFTAYFDGINAILESYGLHTEDLGQIEGESDKCDMFACVYLENGESLRISLDWDYGYPATFMIFLKGSSQKDVLECSLEVEQYPYVYEIAEYLCNRRFSAEQYQAYLLGAKKRAEQQFKAGDSGIVERKNLKSAFFYLGTFSYNIFTENDNRYAEIRITMSLYE